MRVKPKNSIVPILCQWHWRCKLTLPHADNIDAHHLFPSSSIVHRLVFCFSCLSPSSPIEVWGHFEWHLTEQKHKLSLTASRLACTNFGGMVHYLKGWTYFINYQIRGIWHQKHTQHLPFTLKKTQKNIRSTLKPNFQRNLLPVGEANCEKWHTLFFFPWWQNFGVFFTWLFILTCWNAFLSVTFRIE